MLFSKLSYDLTAPLIILDPAIEIKSPAHSLDLEFLMMTDCKIPVIFKMPPVTVLLLVGPHILLGIFHHFILPGFFPLLRSKVADNRYIFHTFKNNLSKYFYKFNFSNLHLIVELFVKRTFTIRFRYTLWLLVLH